MAVPYKLNYFEIESGLGTTSTFLHKGDLTANRIIKIGGTSNDILLGDGSTGSLSGKQNTITLTTSGTSGAATLIGATLNIPQYTDQFVGTVTSVGLTSSTSGVTISSSPITSSGNITLAIATASGSQNGLLSSSDWTTFNNKQGVITLTTTGSSGAATLIGNTLNIPNYSPDLTGYVTLGTTQTITGVKVFNDFRLQLAAAGTSQPTVLQNSSSISSGSGGYNTLGFNSNSDLFFNDGTSSNAAVLSFSNTTTRTYTLPDATGTLALVGGAGVGTVTSVAALTLGTTGTDLSSTVADGTTTPVITLNVPTASATNRGALSSTDWSVFNGKQAAGNYITSLTGEATASGPGAASVTLDNTAVIGKVLTGLNVTGGTVVSTDSILTALGKVQNQINGLIGGSIFQGTWDANTNTPALTSSVGTNGHYYIVSVAGTTNLNGITDWKVGDWAIFAGTTWQKVDNTDAVASVNGYTGTVSLVTGDVLEGAGSLPGRPSQLYFTDARARAAISLTTSGTSGAATYDNGTGVLNIPNYGSALSGYVPYTGATQTLALGTNNGITLTDTGTNISIAITSSSTGQGAINVNKSGTGTGIRVDNNGTGFGFYANNSSTGSGIVIGNLSTGKGLYIDNAASATGDPFVYTLGGGAFVKAKIDYLGNITGNSFIKSGGTSSQFLKADGSVDSTAYQGAITLTTTGSSGASTLIGNTLNIPNYSPDLSGYVTLDTAQTITGAKTFTALLTGTRGSFASSGSDDTLAINHSSGSGIGLSITKGGNGEGLYINKTSGSGNAATIIGTLNATTLVKNGGTSSQFLKADGSVDSTSYGTGSVTSVGLSSATSGVTIGSTPITTSGTITLAIATASGSQNGLLSSTDWTTFNNKQNALTNPVTGTGTTNYLPKFTGASTIGNSIVSESGSTISVIANSAGLRVTESGGADVRMVAGGSSGFFGTYSNHSLQFLTNSATKATLDTSGNLGLGVTPSAWGTNRALQVGKAFMQTDNSGTGSSGFGHNAYQSGGWIYQNNGTAQMMNLETDGAFKWFTAPSGTAGNAISFTQAMTLDASGRLGIGTTSPLSKLQVASDFGKTDTTNRTIGAFSSNDVSNPSRIIFGITGGASQSARVGTIQTDEFGVVSGGSLSLQPFAGNLLIGTTTDAGYKLDVNGTAFFRGKTGISKSISDYAFTVVNTDSIGYGMYIQAGSTNNAIDVFNSSGTTQLFKLTGAGAATFSNSVTSTGFFVSSDITLKTLTQDTFDASKIDAISYKWNVSPQGKTLVGYSAQDVQKYMPDAVNTDSNGQLSVDYIQILVQKIAHLEQKLKEHGLD
jgi:hypothetical protein